MSHFHSLLFAVPVARQGLTQAWQIARSSLMLTSGLYGLLACLPPVHVVLLGRLLEGLDDGWSPTALPVTLALAATVGLGVPLGQIANGSAQRLALRMREHYQSMVLDAAAGCAPTELADPAIVADLQAGHEAARSTRCRPRR